MFCCCPLFQSPIYGSRTKVCEKEEAEFRGFNPLSTGHAPSWGPGLRPGFPVSIPYLRVTHKLNIRYLLWRNEFQSPIYGSRTLFGPFGTGKTHCFNPLSTGHARLAPIWHIVQGLSFNPLSTGHALAPPVWVDNAESGFNPLSTGHARAAGICFHPRFRVSIPYLRVTHYTNTN